MTLYLKVKTAHSIVITARSEDLMAKNTVFFGYVTPCSLAYKHPCFEGLCLHFQGRIDSQTLLP